MNTADLKISKTIIEIIDNQEDWLFSIQLQDEKIRSIVEGLHPFHKAFKSTATERINDILLN